jgi:hypothetical protein
LFLPLLHIKRVEFDEIGKFEIWVSHVSIIYIRIPVSRVFESVPSAKSYV